MINFKYYNLYSFIKLFSKYIFLTKQIDEFSWAWFHEFVNLFKLEYVFAEKFYEGV